MAVKDLFSAQLNVVNLGLGPEERPGKQQRQHGADGKAHHRQEHAVDGHSVGPLLILGSQGPAHQGVDAHGGAGGQTDHQVLGRKRQGNGGQRLLAHPGHEHAVHDVVQRVHQHGDDVGQSHRHQQREHRLRLHKSIVHGGKSFLS